MARKRTPPITVPTAERVDAAVRKGEFAVAVELAKGVFARERSAAADRLVKETVLRALAHYADTGRAVEFQRLVAEVEGMRWAEPEWKNRLAVQLARGGLLAKAIELAEPTLSNTITAHFADWAVRTRSRDALPEPLRPQFDAVADAFEHYRAGWDDPAREALAAVGLSSPFLEWKLLVRGLIAWSTGDDSRAIENFTRLSADRWPFRLAAPIRAKIDPAFASSHPAAAQQYQALNSGGLAGKLRKVQAELAGKKKLGAAFKAAESAVTALKTSAPHLIPRLANCFYHVIARQGEQDDLARYRKLFGGPADDPSFHKLEALVFEEIGEKEIALQRWAAYEGWLSGYPAGWPADVADRARAILLNRMGGIAADLEDEANDPDPFDVDLGGFFAPAARKRAAKRKPIDPSVYLKRAIELAPEWEPPTRELFNRAVVLGKVADAEAAARAHLRHNPQSVFFLNALGTLLLKQGRAAEGLDLRKRALALNPLDSMARHFAAAAHLAHARRVAIAGKPADGLAALTADEELVRTEMRPSFFALRATLFRKLGEKEKAAADEAVALAIPGARLTVRLYLHVNAVLLKLKPADKSAASKAFTAALAEQPDPKEANMLVAGWDVFHHEGLTYTGQKTQEKKIYDAMVRAADGTGPEVEFEGLTVILNSRDQHTLVRKLAPKLARRFPRNPVFPFCLAEAELAKTRGGYKVTEQLRKARALAEASPDERHKRLLPKIEELLKQSNPFGAMFDSFFGGGGC